MSNKNALPLVLVICIFIVIACSCPKSDETRPGGTNDVKPNNTTTAPANANTSKPNTTANAAPDNAAAKPETTGAVTLENFNKLKTGMKYEEVVKILGKEGEVMSESQVGSYKTVMYQWKGENTLSNMNAMFQNGKMISKAQFNLK